LPYSQLVTRASSLKGWPEEDDEDPLPLEDDDDDVYRDAGAAMVVLRRCWSVRNGDGGVDGVWAVGGGSFRKNKKIKA